MIETKEQDKALLEAAFYEKKLYLSYSGLNTLLTAPAIYYKEYILGERDEVSKKYLLEGTLIHYLVLEHQGFNDKFLVASDNLPSDNSIEVLNRVFNEHYLSSPDKTLTLTDFATEIDSILTDIGLHQSVKDIDKRLAKIIEPRSEEYFEFLKHKGDKIIIDSVTLDKCSRRADVIKANGKIRALLGMDLISDGKLFGVYNELPIEIPSEVTNLPFGFRGILDNVVVDVKAKLIRINDFKTTSKPLVEFKDSVDFWNYWLQAAMYHTLIKYFFRTILTEAWSIEFNFVVFDKYDQLYAFPVTPGTMENWLEQFTIVQKEARYHYETRDYSLPYDFALGNITL